MYSSLIFFGKKNELILSDQGNYAFPLLGINVVCFSSSVIFDFFFTYIALSNRTFPFLYICRSINDIVRSTDAQIKMAGLFSFNTKKKYWLSISQNILSFEIFRKKARTLRLSKKTVINRAPIIKK